MTRDFEYAIGFSFLYQDLITAKKLNAGLSDLKTFIFTEKQDKIVGSDTVLLFNRIFGHDSRIVVVLYREEWGNTSFTYVEQEAIRDRKFRDKTERFIIMVNMTEGNKKPEWVSDRTAWYDYKEFGIKGLIATIKHKVNEQGGITRPETAVDVAIRKYEENQFQIKRSNYVNSEQAVKRADEEYKILKTHVISIVDSIKDKFKLTHIDEWKSLSIKSQSVSLYINWPNSIVNTLDAMDYPARLEVTIMKRYIDRGSTSWDSWYQAHKEFYRFNLFYSDLLGWHKEHSDDFISSSNLADDIVKKLLEYF